MNFADASIIEKVKKLNENIQKSISHLIRQQNIDFEPKWFGVCNYLFEAESAPVNEIASSLGITHPAVVQLVNELEKLNLIKSGRDDEDKRKRIITLTLKGRDLFASALPLFKDIEDTAAELFDSAGYEAEQLLNSLEKHFSDGKLLKSASEKYKRRLLDSVEIIRYSPQYKNYFRDLNYEWLNKYFKVEGLDEQILSNPEEIIIKKGGEIFFARINDEIVGTCAAIKKDDNTYELAKMAVTEKARGRQAGRKLALAIIGYAYSNGAKSVILETNARLKSAIALYESIGFTTVPGSFESKYSRPTFRMKLDLK